MGVSAGSPWRFAAPAALMGAIFFLSAQSFEGDPLAWWEVLARKLAHLGGYLLLTAAWLWALAGRSRHALPLAIAISFLYAVSDELHQTAVDGRTGTPRDVAIDALGIALAAGAWTYLRSRTTSPGRAAKNHVSESRRASKTKPCKDAGRPAKRAHSKRA